MKNRKKDGDELADAVAALTDRVVDLEQWYLAQKDGERRARLRVTLEEAVKRLAELESCSLRREPVTPLTAAVLAGVTTLRASLELYLKDLRR